MTAAITLQEMLKWSREAANFWRAYFEANPAQADGACASAQPEALGATGQPGPRCRISLEFLGRRDFQPSSGIGAGPSNDPSPGAESITGTGSVMGSGAGAGFVACF